MTLTRRQKITAVSLLLYWPGLFILTHIPIPRLIGPIEINAPDKVLHYFAYFILVFLLWFAISPHKRVSWRKATVWWVLFVVVWYGVFDEWLQGYVGRNADIADFFADLGGAVTGLVLLTVFNFWSAALIVTGAGVFILTNFVHILIWPVIGELFYFLGYGFFTLLWLRYIHHFLPATAPEVRWLIGSLALPWILLLMIWVFCTATGSDFTAMEVVFSVLGICVVVGWVYLYALIGNKNAQRSNF